jgi:hypothetical protein
MKPPFSNRNQIKCLNGSSLQVCCTPHDLTDTLLQFDESKLLPYKTMSFGPTSASAAKDITAEIDRIVGF